MLFDLPALAGIEVDVGEAVVTVGAGVTWDRLGAALAPRGLRTPYHHATLSAGQLAVVPCHPPDRRAPLSTR